LGTRLIAVLLAVSFVLAGVAPVATTASPLPSTEASAFVDLTGSPGTPAINPATGTIYVPVQCPKAYCPTSAPGRAVDVISTSKCNIIDRSDCRVLATAPADQPLAAAVDEATDTVYLSNAGGTVTVLDGATCNASVTSGCGKDVATIKVGGFLIAEVIDPLTGTLYVANLNGGVDMAGRPPLTLTSLPTRFTPPMMAWATIAAMATLFRSSTGPLATPPTRVVVGRRPRP
jgi:hypothetical protein